MRIQLSCAFHFQSAYTMNILEIRAMRGPNYWSIRRHKLIVMRLDIGQAVEIACDKEETKNILDAAGIPVPKGFIVYDEEDLEDAVRRIGYPIVLKPVNGNHGRGATINVTNWEDAQEALLAAKRVSRAVICEKFITGYDFRLLVIN